MPVFVKASRRAKAYYRRGKTGKKARAAKLAQDLEDRITYKMDRFMKNRKGHTLNRMVQMSDVVKKIKAKYKFR